MATHIDFGKLGEQLAEDFLINKGYTILHRNWRHSHYEIDIVALKDDLPHFVEVKTRSSKQYGEPEESVNKKKVRFLLQAADEFLFQNPQYKNFRIDILSINLHPQEEPKYFFIEDVYL
ncbi:MAG TPA: YraN family protein [Flavisolibacter sp.]|jgi:putative endonuclease|nr:YraN family protein [Flavisolibacter sp.]